MNAPVHAPATITEFRSEHRDGLLSLWRRYFGAWSAERLIARWAWQFDKNPWRSEREPVILVALSGGRVVGHISGIPAPMRLMGRDTIVLAASGLVVEEAHRWSALSLVRNLVRRGPVFAAAMRDAVRRIMEHSGGRAVPMSCVRFELRRRYRVKLVLGVRNRLPRAIAWCATPRLLSLAGTWYRPRGAAPARPLPRAAAPATGRVAVLARFGGDYDALWGRVRDRWACSFRKDSAYMNWRYRDLPGQTAVCLGLFGGTGLEAAAVGVVTAAEDRRGRPFALSGEITELIADSPDSPGVGALLAELMRRLDRRGVDTLSATGLSPSSHALLGASGFGRSDDQIYQAMLIAPALGECPTDENAWYYSAGDGDSLYSPVL